MTSSGPSASGGRAVLQLDQSVDGPAAASSPSLVVMEEASGRAARLQQAGIALWNLVLEALTGLCKGEKETLVVLSH